MDSIYEFSIALLSSYAEKEEEERKGQQWEETPKPQRIPSAKEEQPKFHFDGWRYFLHQMKFHFD
ncbi:hypothetical protein Taro_019434 [Colocasia esculenta]|uniref:Uncharacterized protein n=1 Tax=Colocasia esculenta TaxID=4460 RepID=A0A843UTH4_COLES|nr:hypothetical protein [Colocasia esculenta]